jgi:hypothetical protein
VISLLYSRQWLVDEMDCIRELEIRGIPLAQLGEYLEDLGGRLVVTDSDAFPYVYEGDRWKGELLSEDEIAFTSVFKVNAVLIRFSAETEDKLDSLIKSYRFKTTRVGG